MLKVLHRNRQFGSYAVGEGYGMRPPCDLGLTCGHLNISAIKFRIMLRFSGNLEEACICISSMIMTQFSIFSVSEKGKIFIWRGGMGPPTLAKSLHMFTIWNKSSKTKCACVTRGSEQMQAATPHTETGEDAMRIKG